MLDKFERNERGTRGEYRRSARPVSSTSGRLTYVCFSNPGCRPSSSGTEPAVLLSRACVYEERRFRPSLESTCLVALVLAESRNRSSYLTPSRPPLGTSDQFVWISRDDRSHLVVDALGVINNVDICPPGRERAGFRGPVPAKTSTQDDAYRVRRSNRVQGNEGRTVKYL